MSSPRDPSGRGDDPHAELPLDPDVDSEGPRAAGAPRPLHSRPPLAALVLAGGIVGTAARIAVIDAIGKPAGLPVATLAVNLAGAFVLGLLLESLGHRGPDIGGRRSVRLLAGTGFCGAFTTYSSFAVEVDLLARSGRVGDAVVYLLLTVVVGLGASALGVATASALHRRHRR